MNFDYNTLLAALAAFCIALLAVLFLPMPTDQPPGLALTAVGYMVVYFVVLRLIQFIRQRRRK
jgi:hypothetical protein